MVLDGTDGSVAWAWDLRISIGICNPLWCDLTRDGRPELLVVTRDSRVHALLVDLRARPLVHWTRAWDRSVAQADGVVAARQRARAALRDGRWSRALEARADDAESSWAAAMAARELGDAAALLRHAEAALARGCRRLDLALARAEALPPSESEDALVAALAFAPLADLRIPSLMPRWNAALRRARAEAEARADWRRAVTLAAHAGEAGPCSDRAVAAGADRGLMCLEIARTALQFDRADAAASALRAACEYPLAAEEARDELRSLERRALADSALALVTFQSGDPPRAARLARLATLVFPEDPAGWNDLAWYLSAGRGATREDGLRAVDCASRALDLARKRPGSVPPAHQLLSTLSVAWSAAGDFVKAAEALREALTLDPPSSDRAEYEARLKDIENR
jgi:tetratricopeptide (TPR) repeat protein